MKIIYGNDKRYINLDSGYFFAKAIFETILLKEKPIFLDEHILRLNMSLRKLGINNKVKKIEIEKFIEENNLVNCVLKIIVSEENIIAITREIAYKNDDYLKGFKLCISDVKRNSTSILPYIKSTGYIENILEREKALNRGMNEVLFLNEDDYISECSTSNLFFIKDKKIFTPNISCGLLNGIIRSWIIKNYDVIEGKFKLKDLFNADEVFITNSIIGIMKVSQIESKIYIKNDNIRNIKSKYLKIMEDI